MKRVECEICGKKFRDNYDLKRHIKIHDVNHKPVKNYRVCPTCTEQVDDLDDHLLKAHNIIVDFKYLLFGNVKEFEEWKENIEKETNSRYVKHYGSKRRKNGTLVTNYYCHRVGIYYPRGKNIRNIKGTGSNKINADCPSIIKVEELKQGLVVLYKSTHVGHTCDVVRMSLSKTEKEEIAAKINMKVPIDVILEEIRNTIKDNNLKRIHLSTKQDIRNIIAQYKLEEQKDEKEQFDLEVNVNNEIQRVTCLLKSIKSKNGFLAFKKLLEPAEEIIKEADCVKQTEKECLSQEIKTTEFQNKILSVKNQEKVDEPVFLDDFNKKIIPRKFTIIRVIRKGS